MSALSGIDIALWDLKGESQGEDDCAIILLGGFSEKCVKAASLEFPFISSWAAKSETRSRCTHG